MQYVVNNFILCNNVIDEVFPLEINKNMPISGMSI